MLARNIPLIWKCFKKFLMLEELDMGHSFQTIPVELEFMIARSLPFLAWVNGFERLKKSYGKFFATQITFDLVG